MAELRDPTRINEGYAWNIIVPAQPFSKILTVPAGDQGVLSHEFPEFTTFTFYSPYPVFWGFEDLASALEDKKHPFEGGGRFSMQFSKRNIKKLYFQAMNGGNPVFDIYVTVGA